MSTNDVRAAAERVRRNTIGRERLIDIYREQLRADKCDGSVGVAAALMDEDLHTIAEQYLREHPADDDEPIDEAFCKSLGFTGRHMELPGDFALYHRRKDDGRDGFVDLYAEDCNGVQIASVLIKTRRQLRTLIASLTEPTT